MEDKKVFVNIMHIFPRLIIHMSWDDKKENRYLVRDYDSKSEMKTDVLNLILFNKAYITHEDGRRLWKNLTISGFNVFNLAE